jgi:erythromycin esterase-like protein
LFAAQNQTATAFRELLRYSLRIPESEEIPVVRSLFCLLLLAAVAQPPLGEAEESFHDRLVKSRYQLTVSGNQLSGSAADVLHPALKDAQFVLVGEDHGIAQIPPIIGSLCDELGPKGFHTMALETGPLAADNLQEWLREPDGKKKLAAFEAKYPANIAFYNWSEEFDLLARCSTDAKAPFQLWGLDQELMGASGWILIQILAQKPGPEATRQAQQLLHENDEAQAKAAKSGNPSELFMMSAPQDELNAFRETLQREGNAPAQELWASLLESREIYQKNMTGEGAASNRQRALLMKGNFAANYHAAPEKGALPRVLFKFGAYHMYKGINPLLNNDLGNYVAELADGQGTQSVRILILGVKGEQLRFAGFGRPAAPAPVDLTDEKESDFLFLKPMFENLLPDGDTLFDLRALRPGFHSLGHVDCEMERLIFGYDFIILVPQPTASKPIQ